MLWQKYFAKNGFKHEMDNWRFSNLAASNWNITAIAAGAKNYQMVTAADFLPKHDNDKEMTDDEIMLIAEHSGGVRF